MNDGANSSAKSSRTGLDGLSDAIAATFDVAAAAGPCSTWTPVKPQAPEGPTGRTRRLGALSERYESGGRGPGTVSTGVGDPGGVSYGLYQLATRTGTAAAFVAAEGKRWAADFAGRTPGSAAFTAAWKAVARATRRHLPMPSTLSSSGLTIARQCTP